MGMIHSDPPCVCWRSQQGRGLATCNTPEACRLIEAESMRAFKEHERLVVRGVASAITVVVVGLVFLVVFA
jgi:hypothetical protein